MVPPPHPPLPMHGEMILNRKLLFTPKCTQVTDDFGVLLCELTLDPGSPLPVRQLAAVLLKQYIDVHWSQVGNDLDRNELIFLSKVISFFVKSFCALVEAVKIFR